MNKKMTKNELLLQCCLIFLIFSLLSKIRADEAWNIHYHTAEGQQRSHPASRDTNVKLIY